MRKRDNWKVTCSTCHVPIRMHSRRKVNAVNCIIYSITFGFQNLQLCRKTFRKSSVELIDALSLQFMGCHGQCLPCVYAQVRISLPQFGWLMNCQLAHCQVSYSRSTVLAQLGTAMQIVCGRAGASVATERKQEANLCASLRQRLSSLPLVNGRPFILPIRHGGNRTCFRISLARPQTPLSSTGS